MKSFRLKRLFNVSSGRCFDGAMDHGFFNQPGFLDGIEDMERTVRTIVAAAPDAIQLTLGMARHLQEIPGRNKPSLVLRTDVANIYGKTLPENRRFSLMIEDAMLQAVRHDAVCVCVNLFQIPGAPEVHAECVQNILRLKPQSDHYGMPMMIEPLVFRPFEPLHWERDEDSKQLWQRLLSIQHWGASQLGRGDSRWYVLNAMLDMLLREVRACCDVCYPCASSLKPCVSSRLVVRARCSGRGLRSSAGGCCCCCASAAYR